MPKKHAPEISAISDLRTISSIQPIRNKRSSHGEESEDDFSGYTSYMRRFEENKRREWMNYMFAVFLGSSFAFLIVANKIVFSEPSTTKIKRGGVAVNMKFDKETSEFVGDKAALLDKKSRESNLAILEGSSARSPKIKGTVTRKASGLAAKKLLRKNSGNSKNLIVQRRATLARKSNSTKTATLARNARVGKRTGATKRAIRTNRNTGLSGISTASTSPALNQSKNKQVKRISKRRIRNKNYSDVIIASSFSSPGNKKTTGASSGSQNGNPQTSNQSKYKMIKGRPILIQSVAFNLNQLDNCLISCLVQFKTRNGKKFIGLIEEVRLIEILEKSNGVVTVSGKISKFDRKKILHINKVIRK